MAFFWTVHHSFWTSLSKENISGEFMKLSLIFWYGKVENCEELHTSQKCTWDLLNGSKKHPWACTELAREWLFLLHNSFLNKKYISATLTFLCSTRGSPSMCVIFTLVFQEGQAWQNTKLYISDIIWSYLIFVIFRCASISTCYPCHSAINPIFNCWQ